MRRRMQVAADAGKGVNKIRWRGIARSTWILLGLLFALCGSALAATAPTVNIQPVEVGSGILEVGLEINASGLQSFATVMRYNSTQLELLDWSPGAKALVPQEGQTSWKTAGVPYAAHIPDGIDARPALFYREGDIVYLLIGIQTVASSVVDGPVATLRFRCVDDADGAKLQALCKDPKSFDGSDQAALRFAEKEAAQGVVSAAAQCAVQQDGVRIQYAQTPFDQAPSELLAVTWGEVQQGSSIMTRPVGAVSFLDWDGSLMETALLDKGKDMTTQLNALMTNDKLNMKALLEGKVGYTFDCWLDAALCEGAEDPPLTANNDKLDAEKYKSYIVTGANLGEHLTHGKDDGAVLMAAYTAKRDEATGEFSPEFRPQSGKAGNPNYVYDIENIAYDRYGHASDTVGKYSVTVPVSRISAEAGVPYGVERTVEPGIRAVMRPKQKGMADIYSFQAVENQDAFTFELVPTREMEHLTFALVDTAGFNSWIDAGTRGNGTIQLEMLDVIRLGTASFVMRQARLEKDPTQESQWYFVDVQAFRDMFPGTEWTLEEVEAVKQRILDNLDPPARAVRRATSEIDARAAPLPEQERATRGSQSDWDDIAGIVDKYKNDTIACTIQSFAPQKPIAFQIAKWIEGVDGAEGYYDVANAETYTHTAGQTEAAGDVVKAGGNLTHVADYVQQKYLLSLPKGKYRVEVSKQSHVTMIFEGVTFESYSQGGSPDISITNGDTPDAQPIQAFYMPCGDVTGDGGIFFDDYRAFLDAAVMGKEAPTGSALEKYDLNGDKVVNWSDADIVMRSVNYGQSKIIFFIS